jgi:hypothetical protein
VPEWWPALAVFWTLYLIDGIRGGRRDRIGFQAAIGRPCARAKQAAWHLPPPLPTAWGVVVEDLPCSLAAEGLTNWPAASTSRPPPLPDAVQSYRWEDVREISTRTGWIRVNGRRFAPVTPALDAAELQRLTRALSTQGPTARAEHLRDWHRRRLRPMRLRRRLQLALGRSRLLAELNTGQVAFLLALTTYFLGGGPDHMPPAVRDRIAAALPWWLGGYAGVHVVAVGWFWRLHAKLCPERGQERGGLVLTAVLVPAQGLRLRQHLVAALGNRQHPVSAALALGERTTVAQLTRDTLADIRWPRTPTGLPADTRKIVASAGSLLEPLIHAASSRAQPQLAFDSMFVPLPAASADACAWCPRCGDQFVRPESHCPHGVPLQPLARSALAKESGKKSLA